MTKKKIETLADLAPDPRNVNRGTPRGHGIIERSVSQRGAGRSGLAAADGTMIAGSQTLQKMAELGIPIRPIHTTGEEWVVVIRDDIEPGSEAATLLALEDNRASEVGLSYDPNVLAGIDPAITSALFFPDEMAAVLAQPDSGEWASALGALPDGDRAPFQQMTFTLSDEQAEQVKVAMERARREGAFVDTGNENGNGNALARICETYLGVS